MWIIILILLLITTILTIYFLNNNQYYKNFEGFDPNSFVLSDPFRKIEKESILKQNNAQLFDDITFGDVIMYENDPDGRLGLDKCLDNTDGYCVEYGQTGVAYYYPPLQTYDYYGQVINLDPVQEKLDNKNNSKELKFPALR